MRGHSASKTRVNALMPRASTSFVPRARRGWPEQVRTSPAMTPCVRLDMPALSGRRIRMPAAAVVLDLHAPVEVCSAVQIIGTDRRFPIPARNVDHIGGLA